MKMIYMVGFALLSVLWLIFIFQNVSPMNMALYSFLTKDSNGSSAGLILFTTFITIPMGSLLVLWLKSPSADDM